MKLRLRPGSVLPSDFGRLARARAHERLLLLLLLPLSLLHPLFFGFLSFCRVGGQNVLLFGGQNVRVFGRQRMPG
jgi:hypothetical protein